MSERIGPFFLKYSHAEDKEKPPFFESFHKEICQEVQG